MAGINAAGFSVTLPETRVAVDLDSRGKAVIGPHQFSAAEWGTFSKRQVQLAVPKQVTEKFREWQSKELQAVSISILVFHRIPWTCIETATMLRTLYLWTLEKHK